MLPGARVLTRRTLGISSFPTVISNIALMIIASNSQPLTEETPQPRTHDLPSKFLLSAFPNLNAYWMIGSGLAFWFLLIHTPPLLRVRPDLYNSGLFITHLTGACGVYLACIHNTLITPSMWQGSARIQHVWVGRVGLILGVVGFVAGCILTWARKNPDLSFAIPITIGGCLQMVAQFNGYQAIREYQNIKSQLSTMNPASTSNADPADIMNELNQKKSNALRRHIFNMVGLFLLACGIPAMIRLVDGDEHLWHFFALIGIAEILAMLYAKSFEKKTSMRSHYSAEAPSEVREGPITDPNTTPSTVTTPLL